MTNPCGCRIGKSYTDRPGDYMGYKILYCPMHQRAEVNEWLLRGFVAGKLFRGDDGLIYDDFFGKVVEVGPDGPILTSELQAKLREAFDGKA